MKEVDELWLVSRAALLGDRNAFCRLVEAYRSPIRRFLFHLTGDDELSEDLAQDTFVKAWLSIGSFRAAARFSTWLYRIAYRVFYDHKRSHRPNERLDVRYPAPETSSGNLDLARALAVLKEEERVAMLLFYMEDRPIAKIAKIMNCPQGTVKSHLHRGKAKLAKYFKEDERQGF